jgi:hypothetical protein
MSLQLLVRLGSNYFVTFFSLIIGFLIYAVKVIKHWHKMRCSKTDSANSFITFITEVELIIFILLF